jgi:ABC-type glutathione transport system ATPase component
LERLFGRREDREQEARRVQGELACHEASLLIADKVTDALESLSQHLFRKLLATVETQVSKALQEILDQPIKLCAEVDFKRDATAVMFEIDREGNREDALLGQGGSVANVISVGLRLLALATLPKSEHRGFLVLDEQDCWLRADLVPTLVKIVAHTGRALGFQVVMISHHDVAIFEKYADKIYRLAPMMGGVVRVQEVSTPALIQDPE